MHRLFQIVKIGILSLLFVVIAGLLNIENPASWLRCSSYPTMSISAQADEQDDGQPAPIPLQYSRAAEAKTADVSPDGRWAVIGYYDGLVELYDALTGEFIGQLTPRLNNPVCKVKFSPDVQTIVAATRPTITTDSSNDHTLSSQNRSRLHVHDAGHNPEAHYNLIAWHFDSDGQCFKKDFAHEQSHNSHVVQSFDFTPDGSELIVGYRNPDYVRIINLMDGNRKHEEFTLSRVDLYDSGGTDFVKVPWSSNNDRYDVVIVNDSNDDENMEVLYHWNDDMGCIMQWSNERRTSLMACSSESAIFIAYPDALKRGVRENDYAFSWETKIDYSDDEARSICHLMNNKDQDIVAVFTHYVQGDAKKISISLYDDEGNGILMDDWSPAVFTYPNDVKITSRDTGHVIGARFLTNNNIVFFASHTEYPALFLHRIIEPS